MHINTAVYQLCTYTHQCISYTHIHTGVSIMHINTLVYQLHTYIYALKNRENSWRAKLKFHINFDTFDF